jgi:hypothetical protein
MLKWSMILVVVRARPSARSDVGMLTLRDGEVIDAEGVAVDRQALLAKRLEGGEGRRPVLSIIVEKVRLLEPNVALVDGESKLSAPDGSMSRQNRFSGVLVRTDGAWRIRLIRQLSSQQSTPRQSSPDEPLKGLAWLVGEWVGMGNGLRVHTSTTWDQGRRYILSRFEYEPEGDEAFEADVRVGWDPEAHAIKSWYFDSRGTVSTTTWAKNGDHWLGAITGTQNSGENFTGTIAITQIDDNSYLRTLTQIKVGDQAVPDQELRMFRVAGQPAE